MTTNEAKDLQIASLNTELNLVRGALDSTIHQEPNVQLQREWLQTFEMSLPLTLSNVITHYRGLSGAKSKKRKLEKLEGDLASAEALCTQRTSEVIRHKEELKKILILIRKTARHPIIREYKPLLIKETGQMDASPSLLSGSLKELLVLLLRKAKATTTTDHSPDPETRTTTDTCPGEEATHREATRAPLLDLQDAKLSEQVVVSAEQRYTLLQQPLNVECTDLEVQSVVFVNPVEPQVVGKCSLVEHSSPVHQLPKIVAPTQVCKSANEEATISCTAPDASLLYRYLESDLPID